MPLTHNNLKKVGKEDLQRILDEASSLADVLRKLDYNCTTAGNFQRLKKRITEENLNLDKFEKNKQEFHKSQGGKKQKKKPLEEILVKCSTYNTKELKRRLIKEGLLRHECYECGNRGEWKEKHLALQLDHINGDNKDARIENLRILCPNCHSQTETFSGKRFKIKNYCACGIPIYKDSDICTVCSQKERRKFEVSKEELEKLIQENPFTTIGKMFNVSDNAIRKRAVKLGIRIK